MEFTVKVENRLTALLLPIMYLYRALCSNCSRGMFVLRFSRAEPPLTKKGTAYASNQNPPAERHTEN